MRLAGGLGAEEARHGAGAGEAGSDGGLGYAPGVGGARVGGQRVEAEIGVPGVDARRADEILRVAGARGGGGAAEVEEGEEEENEGGEHGGSELGDRHWSEHVSFCLDRVMVLVGRVQ